MGYLSGCLVETLRKLKLSSHCQLFDVRYLAWDYGWFQSKLPKIEAKRCFDAFQNESWKCLVERVSQFKKVDFQAKLGQFTKHPH